MVLKTISTIRIIYNFSESTVKVSDFLNSSRLNIQTLLITNLFLLAMNRILH